jgi:hypothetical protein
MKLSDSPVPEVLTTHLWVLVCLSAVLCLCIKNKFHHGLHKYPGPFLASFTDWWRFWDVYRRRPEVTHLRLHRKHGDVVRLGPNYLSFANPDALKAIYGLNKGFIKVFLPLSKNFLLGSPRLQFRISPTSTGYSSPSHKAIPSHHFSAPQTTPSTLNSEDVSTLHFR